MNIKVISFKCFRDAYRQALIDWIEDDRLSTADVILYNGIPQLDKDNIPTFIKWAYLQLKPDLPNEYILETNNAYWAVSGDNCIIWKLK